MVHKTGKIQFQQAVFPAELEEIRQRRETLDLPPPPAVDAPTLDAGLVGLALSGGGIRSATFCLGVIQGLSRAGALKPVDYLSTVSGGGFIGACLSSTLNQPGAKIQGPGFPFHYQPGREEPCAMNQLRNSEKYLAPGGMVDKLRIPMLMIRGVLINLFLMFPFIMLMVLFTEVAYEITYGYFGLSINTLNSILMVSGLGLFLLMTATFPFVSRLTQHKMDWTQRDGYERMQTRIFLLALLFLSLQPVLLLVNLTIDADWQVFQMTVMKDWSKAYWLWPTVFALMLVFMFAGRASEQISRLNGKIMLYVLGVSGPLMLFGIYLLMCMLQIDSPVLNDHCDAACETRLHNPTTSLSRELNPMLKHMQIQLSTRAILIEDSAVWLVTDGARQFDVKLQKNCAAGAQDCASTHLNNTPDQQVSTSVLGPFRVITPVSANAQKLSAQLQHAFVNRSVSDHAVAQLQSRKWTLVDGDKQYVLTLTNGELRVSGAYDLIDGEQDLVFIIVMLVWLLVNALLVDVNITSVHGFYRDRLSRAFLFQIEGEADDEHIRQNDSMKLSELNQPGAPAPYHLVNVALNLSGGTDSSLRGRNADFFFYSKRYVGSDRTGYCKTKDMEKIDKHFTLGSAVAISGAAASPNMGTTTIKPLVFVLTLLNIRLNYWTPNPACLKQYSWWRKLGWFLRVGPGYLIKESFSRLNTKGIFVNVSDGGHVENLGIYQLLKRRCKLIIAVDGEADPNMHFTSLMQLTRYARIDLGIRINIDVDKIGKNENGLSHQHWSLGYIEYGPGEMGYLLYLKASFVGDENNCITEYHSRFPQFPHQSTANQFFSEDQFEAYRALGFHVAGCALHGDNEAVKGFAEVRNMLGT